MFTVKNSRRRQRACSPAAAIMVGKPSSATWLKGPDDTRMRSDGMQ
jgi:hypothetical protein